jgi:hypothetical protein
MSLQTLFVLSSLTLHFFKFLPKYFIYLDAITNGIVCLNSFWDSLLSLYRNAIDSRMLSLHPTTLLTLLVTTILL